MTQAPESPSATIRPADLQVIARPNGKTYRPRKVVAHAVDDEDGDLCTGVIVLGTHDLERARRLADALVSRVVGRDYAAVKPCAGWWRDGFSGGRRCWVWDEAAGRAGVWFSDVTEAIP